MAKYLLSTGKVTSKIQEYILDLFKLHLGVNPGDVPRLPSFGFNFTFAGVPKYDLEDKIKFRMNSFIEKIQQSFPTHTITLDSLTLVSESTLKVVVTVDNSDGEDLFINIYES